jgi:non-ribosomal peptide synthetase component F
VRSVVALNFDDAGGLAIFGKKDRDDCGARSRAPATKPHDLVYVFYTSGTTGKPKGVAVEHRGLVRRIAWFDRLYPLKPGEDAVLLKTTYTFGISEWELFWAPTTGASLVVANADGHKFASYVADVMLAGRVTACCFVPSALAALCEVLQSDFPDARPKLRVAISCGEALPAATARLFFAAFGDRARLNNVYGPTEADMTFYEMDRAAAAALTRPPPIGRPMDNVTAYLLDAAGRPVPCGAPGDLRGRTRFTSTCPRRHSPSHSRDLMRTIGL